MTAVKVNRRQSLDLTSTQSPYSGKTSDEDALIKRKGVVRSASFASGSNEAAARRRQGTTSATPGKVLLTDKMPILLHRKARQYCSM